jgi:hypothetical protein
VRVKDQHCKATTVATKIFLSQASGGLIVSNGRKSFSSRNCVNLMNVVLIFRFSLDSIEVFPQLRALCLLHADRKSPKEILTIA